MNHGLAVYSPVGNDGCYDDRRRWLHGKSVCRWILKSTTVCGNSVCWCMRARSCTIIAGGVDAVIFRAQNNGLSAWIGIFRLRGQSLRDLALEQIGDVRGFRRGQKQSRHANRPDGASRSGPGACRFRPFNSQGQTLLSKESTLAVARHIGQKGSNSWFTDSPKEILGENFPLPEGFSWDDLRKEENIFDVWFESGCSWHSVAAKAGWPIPVDLYLEGSDQHRGWFQLSLRRRWALWAERRSRRRRMDLPSMTKG